MGDGYNWLCDRRTGQAVSRTQLTAHQHEGFGDPSEGLSSKYDSRRIRREMSGKFPQPETAGPVLGGIGVHTAG